VKVKLDPLVSRRLAVQQQRRGSTRLGHEAGEPDRPHGDAADVEPLG